MAFKYGRQDRTFNPKIMHMSALMCGTSTRSVPNNVDWTKGITNFGMMLNDQLGCCTCAAMYHARQIWTANVLTEQTEPDNMVLKLYEESCGYIQGDPSTDRGGIEQYVLSYILNTGMPLPDGSREKILGFIEVDPRNINDIKTVINEFGVAYIGFQVPLSMFDSNKVPLSKWSYDPMNTATEGGHAVILVGYDAEGPIVVSWGSLYKMSWEFFIHYTHESYAIVSDDWLNNTGITPLGMTAEQLEQLMYSLID